MIFIRLGHNDWVLYLLHAPFIIQKTSDVNLPLSSDKTQLDGVLVVYVRYGLVLSTINYQQDVEVVFVKVALLLGSTLDRYKCYVHMVINHVVLK